MLEILRVERREAVVFGVRPRVCVEALAFVERAAANDGAQQALTLLENLVLAEEISCFAERFGQAREAALEGISETQRLYPVECQ